MWSKRNIKSDKEVNFFYVARIYMLINICDILVISMCLPPMVTINSRQLNTLKFAFMRGTLRSFKFKGMFIFFYFLNIFFHFQN